MTKVTILYRKSALLNQKVVCAAFTSSEGARQEDFQSVDNKISAWKKDFINKFPEFKETNHELAVAWTTEVVNLF